nr:DUF6560 family protein [uncultured Mediterraneibacter sp.]
MGGIERLSAVQTIITWIAVWALLCFLEKRKKKVECKRVKTDKSYIIQNDNVLFPVFLFGTLMFSYCLFNVLTDNTLNFLLVISFLIFSLVCLFATLTVKFWKVEVNNDIINYRSCFGISKQYNFNDITRGVYKKSGALCVYIGQKRIFTFDDNKDYSLFEQQMAEKGISVEMIHQKANGFCVIRPQLVYYIVSVIMVIFFLLLIILLVLQEKESAFYFIMCIVIELISGLSFFDFLMDKTIVDKNMIYRRRGLKTCKIPISEISGIRIKKNLFRSNLVIYKEGKQIMSIWLKNDGVTWLQAKLSKEKVRFETKFQES